MNANQKRIREAGAGSGETAAVNRAEPGRFVLKRSSEVEQTADPDSSMASVIGWVRRFLACPHAELGRAGPVCPFTPIALELDTIWMTEVADSTPDPAWIESVIEECRQIFLNTEPCSGPMSINKVFMVVFTGLGASDAPLIDMIQAKLKPAFVSAGLMLGEFHARNETPGLRNPDFRPLRSPIPMLVIRHMVESDLPFMKRMTDTAGVRRSYLRSYLRLLGPTLRQHYFDQALDALIDTEIELRSATAA